MRPGAGPVDAAIGRLIRGERILAGLDLFQLASKVGVSYQQMTKYEHGVNRIAASRLIQIAAVLQVRPADLLPRQEAPPVPIAGRQTRELVAAFQRLEPLERGVVLDLARLLAGDAE